MDKLYYKEYYHLERSNWWFIVRSRILRNSIIRLIGKKSHLKILNIGVATGATSIMLQEFGTVTSIEYDEDCYEFTKSVLGDSLLRGSILEIDFEDSSFDLVCAFDVIEHVEDDQLAVDEMKRVCKNGGHVFVTVPAFMSLWGVHDEINMHYRRYKKNQLNALFKEKADGKILYSSYFNFLLFLPALIFRKLNNLLKPLLPKRKGSGSDHTIIPDKPIVNKLLTLIFSFDRLFTDNNLQLPFGVSALTLWSKKS